MTASFKRPKGGELPRGAFECIEIDYSNRFYISSLSISFRRTVRVPDDGVSYNQLPDCGFFPLYYVGTFLSPLPQKLVNDGGVFLPMYRKQSFAFWDAVDFGDLEREAAWIRFDADRPFAVKIHVGGINAVSGRDGAAGNRPADRLSEQVTQDYIVAGPQRWLDSFTNGDGKARQFVAQPNESGYSVEPQLTGANRTDRLQFEIVPMLQQKVVTIRLTTNYPRDSVLSLHRTIPLKVAMAKWIDKYAPKPWEVELYSSDGTRLNEGERYTVAACLCADNSKNLLALPWVSKV